MFSHTSGYALRVAAYLGNCSEGPVKNAEISKATDVPVEYLYKILHKLHRTGLVTTRRGLHGGYTLGRPPASITILEIIQAVEPSLGSQQGGSEDAPWSPLQEGIDQVSGMLIDILQRSTLADLVHKQVPDGDVAVGPREGS